MTPLRDTVSLVDGVERNLDFTQEGHVILLGQGLWSKIEQLGLTRQHITSNLIDCSLVERRVEEVGNARLGRERTHCIHLILHQGDKWGDDNRHTIHQKRGQLVAQRFTATCRHKHKGVATRQEVTNNSLLVSLECGEAKILL